MDEVKGEGGLPCTRRFSSWCIGGCWTSGSNCCACECGYGFDFFLAVRFVVEDDIAAAAPEVGADCC